MKPSPVRALALAGVLLCLSPAVFAESVFVQLKGYEEVPALSTPAAGSFRAEINSAAGEIAYQLSYSGLIGDVRQAHIHFGQRGINGGVSVFLCQTTFNPDPALVAPTCPQAGTVSGIVRASNTIGPAGQGLSAGEFNELVAAIRAGVAYVNVHSTTFPGGEVRGQLNALRNLLGF
ncbi:MAG TPA: CHRD domain-containing protein [Lysobacter sp.]|nr:CHRD domain-containing protein [Lysobacter sp.]